MASTFRAATALVPFARACFELYFGEDRDLSKDGMFVLAFQRADVDPAWILAAIADPAVKARLAANTDKLIARGGFGSPIMFPNGDDIGNDRLPLLGAAIDRRRRRSSSKT